MLSFRFKNAAKHQAKQLLKKIEKPIPAMRAAQQQLEDQAVELQTQANMLKYKVDNELKNSPATVVDKMQEMIKKLEARSSEMKKKHIEYEEKILEYEARRTLAETTLNMIKASRGYGNNEALCTLKDLEEDLIKLEAEASALEAVVLKS